MKVHHLNCGSMHMPGARLVCHVLLVEIDNVLVLVDTGYGMGDIADPGGRVGPFRVVTRPSLVPEETAIEQIRARGFDPKDVRHIILTHGDSDHAGGLSDFPWARVHVSAAEEYAIRDRPSWFERKRYSLPQWQHRPELIGYTPGEETWHGFDGVRELTEIAAGILLIPLIGHSRGHAGIAIDATDRWILHAGDAFYHHGTLDGSCNPPLSLRVQESAFAFDRALLRQNQQRLAALREPDASDLLLINAHDPSMFKAALRSS